MSEKVSEKYFIKRGWTKTDVPIRSEENYGKVTSTKRTIYTINKGTIGKSGMRNYSHVRWDHTYSETKDKNGKIVNKSNWYSLSAFGNNFNIESRISYRKFTVEQIESVLAIVGISKNDRLTFSEVCQMFHEHNEKNNITSQFDDKDALKAVIVFKDSGANNGFSLESRSYVFSSDNKFFISGMCGNSIYARNLDHTDDIRLDWHLNNKDWEIEYCYIKEEK